MSLADNTYDEIKASTPPTLTEDEEKAWKLYCAETVGDMDVRDHWWELSLPVQLFYLDRVAYL